MKLNQTPPIESTNNTNTNKMKNTPEIEANTTPTPVMPAISPEACSEASSGVSPGNSTDAVLGAILEAIHKVSPNLSPASPAVSPPAKPKVKSKAIPMPVLGATAPLLPNLYFDHHIARFWMKMPDSSWIKLSDKMLPRHLRATPEYAILSDDEKPRFVSDVILSTQWYGSIEFAGTLAGYKEGLVVQGDKHILVTSSPKFITPKAGNWTMLRGILERMFGDEQLPYVYSWIKVSLDMFAAQKWMAGQVLVLCGPVDSGKNLFALLLGKLFGGREPGKPYGYMTQATDFNSDIMGCELLTIEDDASLTGIQVRRAFGARIKDQAVNTSRRLHQKHVVPITVVPLQRLVISLNDDPERLQVLPPVEPDIADKMMLIKVFHHPMPKHEPRGRSEFR